LSLQDLLDEEPPVAVKRQQAPGRVDGSGIPMHLLVPVEGMESVAGRIIRSSARQQESWGSLGIEADYEFLTMTGGILNGDFLYTADGRLFQVVSVRAKLYGKGTIPTSWKYAIREQDTGATAMS
jgi:hypothetical protein